MKHILQCLFVALACAVLNAAPAASQKESPAMAGMIRATGTFEVKLTPQSLAGEPDAALGRMSMEKEFQGDLQGTSRGEMLTAKTATEGSAGYVAIERVTGAIGGRKGSFVLQHGGTMTRGEQHLSITVVPDSGTGELTGLTGTMAIRIADGKHYYELIYSVRPSGDPNSR